MNRTVVMFAAAVFALLLAVTAGRALQKEARTITLKGYIVDQMCAVSIQKKADPMARAAKHTRDCSFHPECAASGFGIFVEGRFCGEINLSTVQRGPFQSAYVGYWIDEREAGNGYMPEAVVVLARFAFEGLHLHRIQVSIIPRNQASRRVMEKLTFRDEGVAERYLEINGVWEDHVRFAITNEEWVARREELEQEWLAP